MDDLTKRDEGEKVFHQFEGEEQSWVRAAFSALLILVIVVAGGVTGYFLSKRAVAEETIVKKLEGGAEIVSGFKEVGIIDPEAFSDSAQGRLEANDFTEVDEGSHRLLRFGGGSQTAYLNSTVIDLDRYVGKCVEVWGETFAGEKAGWLMDVGRLKILDKCPKGF